MAPSLALLLSPSGVEAITSHCKQTITALSLEELLVALCLRGTLNKAQTQMSERNGATGLFSSVCAAIAQWCIPMNSCPPRVASLMKCISPGCVCVVLWRAAAEWGGEAQVERSSLERMMWMWWRAPLQKEKISTLLVSHTKILLCHHRADEQSSGGGSASAKEQRSTAERGEGVREGDSRMAGLCGFVKGYKVCSSTRELHRNPNSLQLNERSLIHW